MAKEASGRIRHVIADSAAFLKNAPLNDMCENVYTVEEVVSEIRDAASRQRLAVLPYTIQFRQPSSEALRAVTAFAKLTGDFRSLSAIDLKVLALTYQLEKEHCGIEHIKLSPSKQVEISHGFGGKAMPGFYVEKKTSEDGKDNEQNSENSKTTIIESCETELTSIQVKSNTVVEDDLPAGRDTFELSRSNKTASDKNNESTEITEITTSVQAMMTHNSLTDDSKDNDEGFDEVTDLNSNSFDDNNDKGINDDDDDEDDYDDDDGWITPDNIGHIRDKMGKGAFGEVPANVTVGCLTTDFAMQNVLIQMGLHVISLDGLLIKEARSYVLKCHACFRVTSQLGKRFCPTCGNSTLLKVSVSVDENGATHYSVPNSKKPFNVRGKKFPLPLPKGGRHSDVPILTEDQPRGQHRLPRKRDDVNVFDADYVARASPFAAKDVTSRASQLGYHLKSAHNSKNPNAVRKKNSRRKNK